MEMDESFGSLTASVNAALTPFRAHQPDLMRGFGAMAQAAMRDGALSRKQKELIALALGVGGHCDACIGFHVQALVRLAATRQEVEETLGVAVYMGGGPSLMYAASALRAWDELAGGAEVAAAA
jgi:AhpD family alkylhydroperoxidase